MMKKILGIVVLGLIFSGNAYATIYEIESKLINSDYLNYVVKKFCVDNNVFVYTKPFQGAQSTNLVQMLEERNGKLLPAKC